MSDQFRIAGPIDDLTLLYWSNNDGWVDKYSATIFDDETVNDPIGTSMRVFVDEPSCDICGFPQDCGDDSCTICGDDWDGESGNHFSCMTMTYANRPDIEVYGTPEHEDWLIEMERNEP